MEALGHWGIWVIGAYYLRVHGEEVDLESAYPYPYPYPYPFPYPYP